MEVEGRTRAAESAEEPRAKAPRIANLLVSVDTDDPNYLGLDGENFDRLKLFATTVRDRELPKDRRHGQRIWYPRPWCTTAAQERNFLRTSCGRGA